MNIADHHDEHGERAERRAIAVDKAPQRAFGRARDGLGARVDRLERGGHAAASGRWPGDGGISMPCGWASLSMIGDQPLGRADLRLGRLQRDRAAIHHDEALGDVEDVVDVVADEQHRAAAGAHRAHEAKDLFGFGQRERGGRLVHHDQVRLVVDRARERDALPLAARELADDRIGREHLRGEADLAHQPLGLAPLARRCRASRANWSARGP